MHVVNFDRYRLRLHLECSLLGVPEQRRHRAFDQYTAELVRDDDTVCAAAEAYLVRIDDARADHARAAAAIGSEFLVKVCSEALDWRGAVREDIEAEFMDAMTDVFVLERIDILNPDADKPVLRGMFVQALFNTLSRGMDIVFIHVDPAELPFWRDTVGARQVGDFIAASGARSLPVYPKPPRPVPSGQTSRSPSSPGRRQTTPAKLSTIGLHVFAVAAPDAAWGLERADARRGNGPNIASSSCFSVFAPTLRTL